MHGSIVTKVSPSVLWCAQAVHQTKVHPTPQHGRLPIMDKFCTCYFLSRQMNALSDVVVFILGAVRLNIIDAINRSAVNNVLESQREAKRDSWMPFQAFNSPAERNGAPAVATRYWFIYFKDRSVVTVYTTFLSGSPSQRIQGPSNHTILCLHVLLNITWWLCGEAFSYSKLCVFPWSLHILCSWMGSNTLISLGHLH